MINFGIKLRKLRESYGLTQKALAEKIGIERATVSSYERGGLYPSIENLREICLVFGVSADYLIGLTEIHNMKTGDLSDEQILLIDELIQQYQFLNNQIKEFKTK